MNSNVKKFIINYGYGGFPILCEIDKNELGDGEKREYILDIEHSKIYLDVKEQIKNNVYRGYIERYYENGNMSFKGTQDNLYVYGQGTYYNEDGTLKSVTHYIRGKKHGYSYEFEGNKINKYLYVDDELVSG